MGKRLTLDKFKEKSLKMHGDRYDYSKSEYIGCNIKILIICKKHGEFLQKSGHHMRGQGCPKCRNEQFSIAKIKPLDEVINEFNKVHNNKYDYSEFKYNGIHIPSKIICPQHGSFLQRASDHRHGSGCPICGTERMTSDIDTFIKNANEMHNNKYDYTKSQYVNNYTKIKIKCTEHGIFEQLPSNHLKQHGCPKCAYIYKGKKLRKSQKNYIKECNIVHNNKYDYTNTNYIKSNQKIEIICSIHGSFYQKANNHLYLKHGCPKCGYIGCYTEHLFKVKPELRHKKAMLYLIKFEDDNSMFYKIGITTKTVKERFHSNKEYNITIIQSWDMTLYDAFQIEQKILKEFNFVKYTPPSKIGGDTECFKMVTEVLNLMIHQVCNYQNS